MKKMKKSVKKKLELKRIGHISLCTLIIFVVISVMNKLIFKQDDWLYNSLSWSLAYGIGIFIKPFMTDNKREQKDNTIHKIAVIVLVFMISAFATGVLFDVQRWFSYACSITVPFGVAVVVGTDFYCEEDDDDEESEEEFEGIKMIL